MGAKQWESQVAVDTVIRYKPVGRMCKGPLLLSIQYANCKPLRFRTIIQTMRVKKKIGPDRNVIQYIFLSKYSEHLQNAL